MKTLGAEFWKFYRKGSFFQKDANISQKLKARYDLGCVESAIKHQPTEVNSLYTDSRALWAEFCIVGIPPIHPI